jgi:hypothetical protein
MRKRVIIKQKKKVSFDFDDTLSFGDVQNYAKSLLDHEDIEIHIVTSRFEDLTKYDFECNHDDLFRIADEIGIKKENIHFTNFEDKFVFFLNKDFIWHLDDSYVECMRINRHTATVGVNTLTNFIPICNNLLNLT